MRFKYLTKVHVKFYSLTYVSFVCDQIQFKDGYFDRLIFLAKGIEYGSCLFGEVESLEYYESFLSTETTSISKYDVIGGDFVEA